LEESFPFDWIPKTFQSSLGYFLFGNKEETENKIGAITGYSLNENHQKLATVSGTDKFLKIFDTMNYDMINMTKLNFTPSVCEFIEQGEAKVSIIAV